MRRLTFAASILLAGGGCGPPLDLATDVSVPTCGEDGPVRLVPDFSSESVLRVGDRLVMTGWHRIVGADGEGFVGPSSVVSVGLCGEGPTELVPGNPNAGYGFSRAVATVGDLVLACDSSGRVERIDPRGVEPAMHVLAETMCHFVPTSRGVVAFAGGDLVLLRSAEWGVGADYDTLASSVTWACVLEPCDYLLDSRRPQVFVLQDRVFYVGARVLMEVDLKGESTAIAQDVTWLDVPAGGDRILFSVQPEGGEESLSSFDPVTGSLVELGRGATSIAWPLALRKLGDETTLVDVRDGAAVPLPPGPVYDLLSRSEWRRGTFLTTSSDFDAAETLHRWDDEHRAWVELGTFGRCFWVGYDGDRVIIGRSDCDSTLDMLFVDPSGGESTVAARNVSGRVTTVGDRVVWSTERGEGADLDVYGELFAAEPGNAGRWRLDREAHVYEERPHPDLDGDVLYDVKGGPRAGVWRTALP